MAEWRRGILEKRHQIAVALRVAYGGAMTAAIAMAIMAESREWRNRGWVDLSQPYPSFSSSVVRPAAVSSATNGSAGVGDAHDVLERDDSRRRTRETDDQRTMHATAA